MTRFNRIEARRGIERLHALAMLAHDEGQHESSERLLEPAVEAAERLEDLPLLIRERFWLAEARLLQGKRLQAISTFTWLIGFATDPNQSRRLGDLNTLRYIAAAFSSFLACARAFPELNDDDSLIRVADDGLAWLEKLGKPHWAASLLHERADLLE